MKVPYENGKRFIPVVHVTSGVGADDLLIRNVACAVESGASGVFLIAHKSPWQSLEDAYRLVRKEHSTFWVGLNYLDLTLAQAIRHAYGMDGLDGLWSDERLVSGLDGLPTFQATQAQGMLASPGRQFEFFGSVAFKGHDQIENPDLLAGIAEPYVDIMVTSGPATGHLADPDQIRRMKNAIRKPLAVASGVSLENLGDYRRADAFLVNTSLCCDPDVFEPERVRRMADAIRVL